MVLTLVYFRDVKRMAVVVHVVLWLVLLLNAFWLDWENYAEGFGSGYVWIKTTATQALFLVIFYSNYLFFVPDLLFAKKWIFYGLIVLCFIILSIALQWQVYIWLSEVYNPHTVSFSSAHAIYFGMNGLSYVVLSTLVWYTWNGLKWAQKTQRIEKQKAKAELHALTAKVNPHFLFNSLNNIYALVRKKHEKAEQAILELSGLMRYTLERSGEETVPLVDEIQMMQEYLALQGIRLEPDFQLNAHFPKNIGENVKTPPLLFLPLLENVFKHGDLSQDNRIDIKMELKENWLSWLSKNRIDAKKGGPGSGLSNLKERLDLLYGTQYEFQIYEEGEYYISNLRIPV